jgi:glycosyltransferase involved in cell wall biosynthesis
MSNISACILSYNRADYLCAAIESILQQTVKPAEILIFDNGSDASVYDQIRPYMDRGVAWIGSEINYSAVWNFRRAVAAAKSEFLFVLHDDDRLCSDFIEQQINYLSQNPDVGAVTCNGYLINERAERTGRLLRQDGVAGEVEIYRSPAAVAIRYASDSCLPFSPVVYRAGFVRTQQLREEYGKVVDAVFFCDLARVGVLAFQMRPLYECRVHGAQDSRYFPTVELDLLVRYFENEAGGSKAECKELAKQLTRQHTSRQLILIYHAIFQHASVSRLIYEILGVAHRRFGFFAAISICVAALKKRIRNSEAQ